MANYRDSILLQVLKNNHTLTTITLHASYGLVLLKPSTIVDDQHMLAHGVLATQLRLFYELVQRKVITRTRSLSRIQCRKLKSKILPLTTPKRLKCQHLLLTLHYDQIRLIMPPPPF